MGRVELATVRSCGTRSRRRGGFASRRAHAGIRHRRAASHVRACHAGGHPRGRERAGVVGLRRRTRDFPGAGGNRRCGPGRAGSPDRAHRRDALARLGRSRRRARPRDRPRRGDETMGAERDVPGRVAGTVCGVR